MVSGRAQVTDCNITGSDNVQNSSGEDLGSFSSSFMRDILYPRYCIMLCVFSSMQSTYLFRSPCYDDHYR